MVALLPTNVGGIEVVVPVYRDAAICSKDAECDGQLRVGVTTGKVGLELVTNGDGAIVSRARFVAATCGGCGNGRFPREARCESWSLNEE
jgi:hypothetical protein